jgi:hypothetical protein
MTRRVNRLQSAILALFAAACSKSPDASQTAAAASAPAVAAAGGGSCPVTGMWAECSIIYRLDRSGLVPHVDSSAKPAETTLGGKPLMIKIGTTATLELHLYPDSTARVADGTKLDRAHLVGATAPQTIERERTLIENSNIIGLLTSLNSHQRERVSDAVMAGPPQPQKPPNP